MKMIWWVAMFGIVWCLVVAICLLCFAGATRKLDPPDCFAEYRRHLLDCTTCLPGREIWCWIGAELRKDSLGEFVNRQAKRSLSGSRIPRVRLPHPACHSLRSFSYYYD